MRTRLGQAQMRRCTMSPSSFAWAPDAGRITDAIQLSRAPHHLFLGTEYSTFRELSSKYLPSVLDAPGRARNRRSIEAGPLSLQRGKGATTVGRNSLACLFALVLGLTACSYTPPGPAPIRPVAAPAAVDALEHRAQLFMDQGAVAAVVQIRWPDGEWSKAWGVRDLDSKTPAQPSDFVEVAGITNTMTAVTVLKLVDDGLIGLDDPVNDVVPGFKTALHPPGPITARQLLGHISGIPEFTDFPSKESDLRASRPWEPSSVGTFSYSNTGYVALGLLVETLRHKPFPQVLREEVIEPLGLKNTTIERLDLREPRLIHGYITVQGKRLDVTDNSSAADSPSEGVTSTVADLNTFYAALLQGKLISARSLEEMKKRPSLAPYALGMWTWPDGCTGGTRFEGRGSSWAYLTIAVASDDGKYTATMTVVPPPLPTGSEDWAGQSKRDLWGGQLESNLNEAVDAFCQRSPN